MYLPKNFDRLLGVKGLSDQMLQNHFTLYQGYVKNTNALIDLLEKKEIGTPEYSELQRRLGWEWNGMRLHEWYFENMTKEKSEIKEGVFKKNIQETYSTMDDWKKNFIGIGAMRGIGWVILYYDFLEHKLLNAWINEHDEGHFSGCRPLLVMDVFEHAFMLDYGLKRADYIEVFWNAIDWSVVEKRISL